MALGTVTKHFTDVTLQFADGTGTPVTLTVPRVDVGISLTGLSAESQEESAYQTRAVLNSVRAGALTFPSISMTIHFIEFTNAAVGNVLDFVFKTNGYSANTTTLANGDVYTVDVTMTVEGLGLGEGADGTITIPQVRFLADVTDGSPMTIGLTGTCYGVTKGTALARTGA
jgi:hypothetical protein